MRIRYTRECLEAAEGKIPRDANGRRPIGIAVFESPFMEHVLGRAHPVTPVLWFGPIIAYGVHRGATSDALGPLGTLGLYLAGWLVWTLTEYILHRWVFHMAVRKPEDRLRAFLMHGYHHEFPSDPTRLVAPPMMSWPLGLAIWTIFYYTTGSDAAWALFAGTSTGYIAYDWIHYYTHHFKPGNPVGRWLRAYHLLHHHDAVPGRYGVSTPLWDFVFGTYFPLKKAAQPPSP